jgi:CRISPR-associated endonuclease/helicase Cas3
MEWISHDDRTLKEHLSGLKEVVEKILPEKTQTFFNSDELTDQVFSLIAYHDVAKASIYFQIYLANALIHKKTGHKYHSVEELETFIKNNRPHFVQWQNNPELKRHALLGAWLSLSRYGENIKYSLDAFLFSKVLKYHHGYLKNFNLATTNPINQKENLGKIASEIDFEKYEALMKELGLAYSFGNIQEQLENFKGRSFDKLVMNLNSNQDPSHYFKTLFLYSILLSADKGDMMLADKNLERKLIPSGVIDDFKEKNIQSTHTINELREKAYQVALTKINESGTENFFSITLPTGMGKTFTAYKIALELKEKFCPNFRIIYCLPFTSIIDQNAIIFKNILESFGIDPEVIGIHHHLAVPKLTDESDDSSYSNWEYITEGWQNEITITTFVQLWESLFACHNRQLRKFHNLANSVIILDEIQAINPELYPAFEFVMEYMARYFNTKFIFVTATQPMLLKEKVQELCMEESEDFFFRKVNRTNIDKSLLKNNLLDEYEIAGIILEKYNEQPQSTLVICNTIRFSQNVYELVSQQVDSSNTYYLSAAIIPFTREKILDEIRRKLEANESIILISTQVIEAGVDVDFDVVYRDFAPLSSINQAAGRCNRNATKGVSNVYLFKSGKHKIYDPTQLNITQHVLDSFDDIIKEDQFYTLNSSFFKEIKHKIQDSSQISRNLVKDILTLKFEDIGTNPDYRLFREEYQSYNFFIPINENAEKVWEYYLSLMDIDEHFKRKQKVKLFIPEVMKFVIKVPSYIHTPEDEDLDKAIIYDEYWTDFYNETFGYHNSLEEVGVEVI